MLELFIEAFKNKYEYDEIDEKDFESEKFIKEIDELIENYKYDSTPPSEDRMAEDVYELLYFIQYGNTSDVDDNTEIYNDIHERFPNGR